MISLRRFHEVFVLVAIVMAEMFGGWAVYSFRTDRDPLILALGIATLLGGIVMAAYALFFERAMDHRGID